MAEPKFEKDLERLEAIVQALEQGGLSLDDSLKKFEEGIKLAKRCEKALSQAEKRIEILTKNAEGELEAQPFASDAAEAEDSNAERANGGEVSHEPPGPAHASSAAVASQPGSSGQDREGTGSASGSGAGEGEDEEEDDDDQSELF